MLKLELMTEGEVMSLEDYFLGNSCEFLLAAGRAGCNDLE